MILDHFQLDSGAVLYNVPVAYTAYGLLAPTADNVIVVCHAFSGNTDVASWWRLIGHEYVLDPKVFYIICLNSLGSPYGTAAPTTSINGDPTLGHYGPLFPSTSIRDDVRLHKQVLDRLGVRQVACVIGGSMGGMLALEWAYMEPQFVRTIVAIATCARTSAWSMAWSETQRRSIRCDPKFNGGWYDMDDPPVDGLAAARLIALLTYRAHASFESRFGGKSVAAVSSLETDVSSSPSSDYSTLFTSPTSSTSSSRVDVHGENKPNPQLTPLGLTQLHYRSSIKDQTIRYANSSSEMAVHSYLRYQAKKFNARFDANCYIAMADKIDRHDISRGRVTADCNDRVAEALSQINQPVLILGIPTDVLYPYSEQQQLAAFIPRAVFEPIHSADGHDGFLLESDQINVALAKFFGKELACFERHQ
ncbi:hypothetical protein HFD88_009055 [Aspergillus terreus]|nr:hypothetical protein HFD88_009055 [Aspergillus terreus]